MSSTNPFTRARLAAEAPRFRKLSDCRYEVSINGTVAGQVEKRTNECGTWWVTFYNDGSQGHTLNTRTIAAWSLINS